MYKEILDDFVLSLMRTDYTFCGNERYLHHLFSHKIQEKFEHIDIGCIDCCNLHPEWATYLKNKRNKRNGGRYKFSEKEYKCDPDGKTAFFDFALGDYNNPTWGIEFKFMKNGWRKEGIVFDYMKLLDKKNEIENAFSVSILLRAKAKSSNICLTTVNETISSLKKRLDGRISINRPFEFWIIESIPEVKQNRILKCANLDMGFQAHEII